MSDNKLAERSKYIITFPNISEKFARLSRNPTFLTYKINEKR